MCISLEIASHTSTLIYPLKTVREDQPLTSEDLLNMNSVTALWMLCSVLKASSLSWAAPTSPLEISGDQTPPEFRDGLERNKDFVFQIWNTIQTLLEMHQDSRGN
ncbi:uncharacterized protein LOC144667829 isoform X1 [Cetorhinus maximus]